MVIQLSFEEFQKESAGKIVKQSIRLCLLSNPGRWYIGGYHE